MAAALHIAHGAQQHFKVIVVAGKIHFIGISNQKRRVLVKVEKAPVFIVDLLQIAGYEENYCATK